jgi:dipeptidyl aminopeptidase/acylaminoacyl peptidase
MSNQRSQYGLRTRRGFLLGLTSMATGCIAWRAMGAGRVTPDHVSVAELAGGAAKAAAGLRPYAWGDALMRSEVNSAEVSAKGDVALVVTRPLSAKGAHYGIMRPAVVKRGDLWLCNSDLSSSRKLELDDRWVWSPSFSPGGTRLAALTTGGDGRVGLAVWDLATGQVRQHDHVNVDIYGRLRTVGREDRAPSYVQLPLQFVWIGEDRIMFIASGDHEMRFDDLSGPSSGAVFGRLRDRALRGEASVRTWSPQAGTCFIGRRLMLLDLASGATTYLYTADVRGVSLSADARWAAILQADKHVAIDPDARQNAPLRYTDEADDPMVSCSLVCLRVADGTSFELPEFAAVGNVAPSRLPVWSRDSRRFAVASRLSYSSAVSTGDDSCWEVEVDTRSTRRWEAASAADAEFIAALVAANEKTDVEHVVRGRKPMAHPPMGTAGQISAQSWVLGPGTVAKWVGSSLSLVHGTDETPLADECSTVASPVPLSTGGHLVVATRKDRRFEAITLANGRHQTRLIDPPPNAALLCATADGRVLCKQDAADGSRIYVSAPGKPVEASPFVLNRHLAEVRTPHAREVVRMSPDGKRLVGILMTPTDKPAGTKSPVIVWAYPNSVPTLEGSLTRVNDYSAVYYPFQYLLARGFAVFLAPLPMTERPDEADPLDYVANSIVPWLDVLDQQPEIEPGQYGFWGHSDAGYAALALEATTDRFKAIAAASTFPDLAEAIYSARLPFQSMDCAAYLIQTNRWYYEAEDQRYQVGGSLWQHPERFVRNSALFRMEHAVTPMLLMVGEFDADPRAMEEVYSVLHGKGVPVEMAYYWGEEHMIMSRGNLHDLWIRSERFFNRYLGSPAKPEQGSM